MTQMQNWIGVYDQNQKACAQLIFQENIPTTLTPAAEDVEQIKLLYTFSQNQTATMNLFVGVFDVQNLSEPEILQTYSALTDSPTEIVSTDPLYVWDYLEMIEHYKVSYVVFRDARLYSKFSEDKNFRLVFNSGDIAVFQLTKRN
jgi:hypothetical protein